MLPQQTGLEQETIRSLLSNRVRTYLLQYLSVAERTTVADVAEKIAAWKRKTTASPPVDGEKAVTIQLIHNHLPRLAQHDVVDYEHPDTEITPGPNFDQFEPYVSDLNLLVDAT